MPYNLSNFLSISPRISSLCSGRLIRLQMRLIGFFSSSAMVKTFTVRRISYSQNSWMIRILQRLQQRHFLAKAFISRAMGVISSFFILQFFDQRLKLAHLAALTAFRAAFILLSMQETQSLQDFKDCFAPSIFFSTQPSSCSIIPSPRKPSPHDTLPKVEPRIYLRELKLRKKQATGALLSALCESVKARSNLDRAEHQASICRQQFLKLYHNKKFKLIKDNIIEEGKQDNEYVFRQTVNRIRQQKLTEKEAISDRREIQLRNVENLQQNNKLDQKIFRETLRRSEDKLKHNIFANYSKVKKEKADFSIRKKNLNDLNTTRSKFNYLSKINNEMQVIKSYQQELQKMSNSLYQDEYQESVFAGPSSARYS